jgi:hypothetical protein
VSIRHIYVDPPCAGHDLELDDPAVAAGLSACGRCSEDFQGRLAPARDTRAE